MSAQSHLTLGTAYLVAIGQTKIELRHGSGAIHQDTPFLESRRSIELGCYLIEALLQGVQQGIL
jgi:hypothetical protein